jgi:ribose 1,5-bisphosphokinase
MSGLLVLVVGPSGSGKDTLLAGAAEALQGDGRFIFTRRAVTRIAAHEDHESLSVAEFHTRRDRGEFALSWEAHGLFYGVPKEPLNSIAEGAVVVANVSRSVVDEASRRYPVRVVEITAPEALRSQRLSQRQRESANDISSRLARQVTMKTDNVRLVVNDGSIADGINALVGVLTSFLARCLPDPART